MDLIPGINVRQALGNVWGNITSGRSPLYGDVIPGMSLSGGERQPTGGFFGPTATQQNVQTPTINYNVATDATGGTGGGGTNYSSDVLRAINAQMGNIDTRQNQANVGLEAQYGQQKAALESSKLTGTENLKRQAETTTRQKNIGLRDLSQNIRNAYQAGMNRLGVGGAADSSAAGMYKYALGQQEAQNKGQILSDYNYNLGNIQLATTQLERGFKEKMDALNIWKQQQAADIANRFQDARNQLEMQRAQYGGGYVSQAQSQLAQNAINQLANLSTQVGDASNIIANDFAKAQAELRGYSPENITPDVSMQTSGMPQATALQIANPALYKKYTDQTIA